MRLKITEQGWETFSGNLGVVVFEDGVSVGDVSHIEANIISGNIRVVELESGDNVGALELDSDMQNKRCESVTLKTMAEIFAEQVGEVQDKPVEVETVPHYTKDELEAIADKKGIAGLREIGDQVGVKGTSISGIIEAILLKVAGEVPNAAPLAAGQPNVETSEQAE